MKGTGNSSYFFRVCLGARCLSVYCTISLLFWIPSFPLIPEVGRWSLCGLSSTMAVVEPGCGGSLVHASVEKVACCTAGSALQITFLVQTVYFLWKMSFQFGTLVGRGLMDPSLFSSVTQGWQLSGSFTDPLYFSPPPRQVKAWSLAKDLYPEWCLNHLPMGKRWPKRQAGASCHRVEVKNPKQMATKVGRVKAEPKE